MPLKQERPVAASTRPGALINVRVHPRGGCDRVKGIAEALYVCA